MDENSINLLFSAINTVSSLSILVLWLIREIRRSDLLSESDREELEKFREIARQKMTQTNT